MKIAIKTLGCKSNRYESDKVFDELRKSHEVFELNEGISTFRDRGGEEADLLIVNTCTVTHVADRKSRQAIRSFKRVNPGCKVIAFGCGVNVSPDAYKRITEVDLSAKNADQVLEFAKELAGENFEKCEYGGDPFAHGMRTRAVVKIQDGCNRYCSYCIIPMARGPEVSFSSKVILKEVQKRERAGFKEIVLTGIIISEWKEDGMDLADLLTMLIDGTKKVRFRLSSIEPSDFSVKFLGLFRDKRFCPHMHMSLQSGSDCVLKRMRRYYDTDLFLRSCERLRRAVPDIGLTTDVIVGFPGETDEEFRETCDLVEKIGFLKVHVFPYSKREKTVAAYMKDQVPDAVKRGRAAKLRRLAEDNSREFKKSLLGREYEVLIEENRDGLCRGYTSNYIPIQFLCAGDGDLVNEVRDVKLLKSLDSGIVEAELSKKP